MLNFTNFLKSIDPKEIPEDYKDLVEKNLDVKTATKVKFDKAFSNDYIDVNIECLGYVYGKKLVNIYKGNFLELIYNFFEMFSYEK